MSEQWFRRGGAVVTTLVWAMVYGLPLAAIMGRSLSGVAGRAGLSGSTVVSVFTDQRLGRLALVAVGQTVASAAIVVLLGVPIAWVVGRLDFPGRRAMSALVMAPFVLPTLSVALALTALVDGVPESTSSRFALIVAAHVVFNLGIMVRSVSPAVAAVPPTLEHAARALGRRPVGAILSTTVAAVLPAILGAALIVAMFCATSFGIVLALGGARLSTIEVEVWVLTTRSLDLARAAVLVIAQLAVVLALVRLHQRVRIVPAVGSGFPRRPPASSGERLAVALSWFVVMSVAAAPLASLVVRSMRADGEWSLANYRDLPIDAIARTVAFACSATVLALAISAPVVIAGAVPDRLGRGVESAMMIPFAMSAATLGVGYLIGYGSPLIDLRGTWFIVPLVQAAAAAPIVVRILLGAVRQVDRRQLEASAVSGAGLSRRAREILWPTMRRSISVALGFAFAMSVGEFGATVFLARRDAPTVSVIIGRLVGRPGTEGVGRAMALSVVLAAIAATSVFIAERRRDDRSF